MNFDSVLVITYGRSGSTLLQGLLNSINGCLIRGENYNLCYGLYYSYKCLLKAKHNKGTSPQDPWYGTPFYQEDVFIKNAGKMVKELLLAKEHNPENIRCYGFKEIRYLETPAAKDEFEAYLSFLSALFNNVSFIFNTRNLADVTRSGWWSNAEAEKIIAELKTREQIFSEYASSHNNCFQITYEDLITKSPNLEAMFDFLGAPYSSEKIDEILSKPHSYNPTQEKVKKLFIDSSAINDT